jgi:hypothetical protein
LSKQASMTEQLEMQEMRLNQMRGILHPDHAEVGCEQAELQPVRWKNAISIKTLFLGSEGSFNFLDSEYTHMHKHPKKNHHLYLRYNQKPPSYAGAAAADSACSKS